MASPQDITVNSLAGDWQLNKELSDNLAPALEIQGMPYLVRKAMSYATVTEKITETTKANGTKVLQVAKAAVGLKGSPDIFDTSGEEQYVDGGLFGPKVRVRSWWVDRRDASTMKRATGEALDPYLLQDWIDERSASGPDYLAGSGSNETTKVETDMIMGFTMINGARYRAAKYHIRKGNAVARVRMVFSWVGSGSK